jgi:hypothetical protein
VSLRGRRINVNIVRVHCTLFIERACVLHISCMHGTQKETRAGRVTVSSDRTTLDDAATRWRGEHFLTASWQKRREKLGALWQRRTRATGAVGVCPDQRCTFHVRDVLKCGWRWLGSLRRASMVWVRGASAVLCCGGESPHTGEELVCARCVVSLTDGEL